MFWEGPTPVSALIHAATMVTAGVYLLIRCSPLIEYSSTVLILCLWLGAITTVFSSLIGLFQQDIKKVIAYSTMSQLGIMVLAVGLSSYNIALFHLVNHAFYKALLFLGAGSVIHAVADNQDFRKYGGLRPFLPLTYSVMLIASLSLVAFPFMTGFYSKDFILESAYGQFYFSSTVVYFIATIGAMFTTLYSVKVLYLTFLTNPAGPLVNYKIAHEGDIFMSLPLIILAFFSIFFGYITKDIFIGLGSGFFNDNGLFIHPSHEILLDTEFAVPTLIKLLPLIFTILLTILAIVFSEFYPRLLISFKCSRLGYYIFSFFNQRFYIELFYNKYITDVVLKLGGQTIKVLDKGSIELLGPYGLEKGLLFLSNKIASLDTGVITSYALYITVGLIFYMSIPYLDTNNLLIIVIFALLSLFSFSEVQDPENKNKYASKANLCLIAKQSGVVIKLTIPLLALTTIISIPDDTLNYIDSYLTNLNNCFKFNVFEGLDIKGIIYNSNINTNNINNEFFDVNTFNNSFTERLLTRASNYNYSINPKSDIFINFHGVGFLNNGFLIEKTLYTGFFLKILTLIKCYPHFLALLILISPLLNLLGLGYKQYSSAPSGQTNDYQRSNDISVSSNTNNITNPLPSSNNINGNSNHDGPGENPPNNDGYTNINDAPIIQLAVLIANLRSIISRLEIIAIETDNRRIVSPSIINRLFRDIHDTVHLLPDHIESGIYGIVLNELADNVSSVLNTLINEGQTNNHQDWLIVQDEDVSGYIRVFISDLEDIILYLEYYYRNG